jgi:hypothetical protein
MLMDQLTIALRSERLTKHDEWFEQDALQGVFQIPLRFF